MWPFFFSLSFFSFFFETFLLVSKEIREGISFRSWKLPRIDRINEDFYRNRSWRMREELEILKIYGRIFWIWMRSSDKNLIWKRLCLTTGDDSFLFKGIESSISKYRQFTSLFRGICLTQRKFNSWSYEYSYFHKLL